MPSTLVETAVAANCTSDHTQLKSLVPCLVEALSSDDWATRKAAVETLVVVVDMERDFLSEFKGECVRVFENRWFDKVCVKSEDICIFYYFFCGNVKVN